MKYYIYDLETFPNIFTCVMQNAQTKELRVFELSIRQNDLAKLLKTLQWLSKTDKILVGYNNLNFDYAVLQYLYKNANNYDLNELIYKTFLFADELIKNNTIYKEDKNSILLKQLDLMKIHNFDYKATRVSLKVLEVNMCMDSIEDLNFTIGENLKTDEFDNLIKYNKHDVEATLLFFNHSLESIEFRESLSSKYNEYMLNYSDTKIGKRYFIRNLEEKLGKDICYINGKPRQTVRNFLNFGEIIFDYVKFESFEFQALLKYLKKQYTNDMSKVFSSIKKEDLEELSSFCNLNAKNEASSLHLNYKGFSFYFGTGGLHGSVEGKFYDQSDEYLIIDVDVASYYPSIVIQNRLYPEHLGAEFVDIYKEIRDMRFSYKKGTSQNKMLKLALNSAYGDTNNQFSPFYDYKMTLSITLNGQLMLCMLAEKLMSIDSVSLIQANTDGLTFKIDKKDKTLYENISKNWQEFTGLELEEAIYKKLWIRDVNNYIALKENGEAKKIGAYKYELAWNQNHSCLVVQKAVEAHLLKGISIEEFIHNHRNKYDFLLNTKATKNIDLVLEKVYSLEKTYVKLPNTIRYFISKNGLSLKKILPPLNNTSEQRVIGINVGYKVELCNKIEDFSYEYLDFDFYIKEAYKLIEPFKQKQESLFDFS
ncbi:DNA polymerase domain-containing protein [Arcobacter roscoffensis]|uniref:DNA-directed DNA polymerase n=1 Tax=Arcobacter roscoffensis TaxID=2961520 RepID=A0ABY5E3R1_9BACT|nr:DNA polymerase domain-containing protein [Arcobacter roscoffensis]UTJ05703.1 hypothetical protein NJU99_10570 [Arcobacter roscoffensis]